jgi:hypothetical protein
MIGAPALGVGRSAAMRLHERTSATADTPDVVTIAPPVQRPRTPVTRDPRHRQLPRP